MNLTESVKSAVINVFSNKMRSILTMLGIIIGISSVIMITSVGTGFKNSISDTFSQMGIEGIKLMIKTDKEIKNSDYFTENDITFLKQNPNVNHVSPVVMDTCTVNLRTVGDTQNCIVLGTNNELKYSQSIKITNGRFLMDKDSSNHSNVVVIDGKLSRKIFGREDSVGEKIKAKFKTVSIDLTVVGIFKSEDVSVSAFNMPSYVYVPYTTLLEFSSSKNLDTFLITAYDKNKLDALSTEIVRLLEIRHNTSEKYYTQNIVQTMESINNTLNMVTSFIVLVAAISLLVGGIGVMNIMLVTVTERTREIGIRKSLGATNANIKFQFLIEAVILTVIGGILGIILGYSGGSILGSIVNVSPDFSIGAVFITVLISSAIGIIFGVYPAGKAAKLDPIEALRYE